MLSELYETDQGIPERRRARSILLRVRDRDHGAETFGRGAILESGIPHSILKRNSNRPETAAAQRQSVAVCIGPDKDL